MPAAGRRRRRAPTIRGKTLGIVGHGNIGSQLAVLAEAMGMRVIFYDRTDKLRHGNAEPRDTLEELLAESDVVSLHVPETPETKGMFGEAQFRAMKPGSFFINNARGTVYDPEALARALKDKHLAGAAVDVFPSSPNPRGPLRLPAARPRQRHPHAACRRLDAGSAGAHRLGSGAQAGRIFRRGLDARRGELPAGAAAAAPGRTRFIQVHKNLPGELGRLNEVFARHGVNIAAQYLQTDGEIGYVVLDADGSVDNAPAVLADIRALPGTIRAPLLYRRRLSGLAIFG